MAEANEEAGEKLATIPVEENDNPELQVQPGTGPQPIATRPEAEASLPEKLNDNDEDPKTLWERFIGLFPCFTRFEDMRRVYANDRAANIVYRYSGNTIKTSRYNVITFLPINLLEQFTRVANFYFLVLVIIQVIPGITSVPVYSTLFPLLGVLTLTAVKDLYDDVKRHISDYKINNRPACIVTAQAENAMVKWKNVKVGDVLRLENNDFITADLLLLSSSEPNGLVYIETAELDGETNLKVKQSLPETAEMKDMQPLLGTFNGYVECEAPNNRLYKFIGKLIWNEQQYTLDNNNILLRGCRLRNTQWMYGLVVYAGHDTKLVKNSGRTKFKRTRIDVMMNRMVLFILGFLGFCVFCTLIGSLVWESVYGVPFQAYVPFEVRFDDPGKIGFVQILSNIVVLNTFVPISLYVSVEAIRLGLSFLINWDIQMYYEPTDIPAVARTTTLNEELGQIEYIFSDKTGTLTQNIMKFIKCSINGVRYGERKEDDEPIDLKKWNVYADEDFKFYDEELISKCRRGDDKQIEEFFKLIAVCHTVLPAQEDGVLKYNAQSPDEAALVAAAKNFGYAFTARTPFTVAIDLLNREQYDQASSVNYEVLNILDFNNERKRMSVIVKDPETERILLYCKGADTVIYERLHPSCDDLKDVTLTHLSDYATEGLRTLVLAMREISVEEYGEWVEDYHEASLLAVDREKEVDKVYDRIEQNLMLLGATAIEDKLQDGVPEVIDNLSKANLKIWVLTGDKQETAINIGYSSKLLKEDMKVFVINSEEYDEVQEQLQDAIDYIRDIRDNSDNNRAELVSPTGPPFGIVINGSSLRHALKPALELMLLEAATECNAVICCRVTPLQKKRVVDLVKVRKNAVTLAIGDGANDVGMIKAAHIGVGISGLEGQQAVLSSDYAFGQFRYLEKLLLVHGRWSYHRMTLFLTYFFYKNFAFTFSQFIYAFFCGFTAETLYDPGFIAVYNVIYTSLPIVALAIVDQDCTDRSCLSNPRLYIASQKGKFFNNFYFIMSLLRGIYVAIVVFFVLFGITYLNIYQEGYEWDYQSFAYAASGALVCIVNIQVALDTHHWNGIIFIFIAGSILSWWVVPPFLSNVFQFYSLNILEFWGVSNFVLGSLPFWLYLLLSISLGILPIFFIRTLIKELSPTLLDDVKLYEAKEAKQEIKDKIVDKVHKIKPGPKTMEEHPPSINVVPPISRQPSYRSGYAYSHEQGFGQLIATGRYLGANESEVEEEIMRRRTMSVRGTSSDSSRPVSSRSPRKTPPVHAATLPEHSEFEKMTLLDDENDESAAIAEIEKSIEEKLQL
jgi:phospholipid-translocating ATPase